MLFRGHGNAYRLFGHSVYTFSLVFLFSMSGVYHLLEPGGVARMTLQRLDHAGIYVLIAGTFTAVHFTFFNRKKRWIISTFVWILSITGLVLTVIFMKNMPQLLLSAFYLGLGWIGIFTGYFLYSNYGFNTFRPLLLGGCVYSIGAIIMYLDWPVLWPGVIQAHEIFHVAVIIAAYTHWKLVYQWSANPSSHRLTFIVRKEAQINFSQKPLLKNFL
ncbi:MAG: hemolysin III family protein [Bdellovibrionota bacterium]